MSDMHKAAKKAWKTRRQNEAATAAKWTKAGKKAWATRRKNESAQSQTGLRTLSFRELQRIRKSELRAAASPEERDCVRQYHAEAVLHRRRHLAAKKAWRTMRANAAA